MRYKYFAKINYQNGSALPQQSFSQQNIFGVQL